MTSSCDPGKRQLHGTGAGERLDGMMNGTGLTPGSIAKSGAVGGGRFMATETGINNDLMEVGGGGLRKVT